MVNLRSELAMSRTGTELKNVASLADISNLHVSKLHKLEDALVIS